MTSLIRDLSLLVLTPDCYDEYFLRFNFLHGECMKATISRALGIVIILGSFTVKVPQILQIVKHKSGEGISLKGSLLELSAITSVSAYCYVKQFPLSAWGDGLLLAFQTAAIIALILLYQKQLQRAVVFLSVYSVFVAMTVAGAVPVSALWLAQFFNMPIVILGKGVQAMANYRAQSTGQLSKVTLWMQFGGCLARVFTSAQETGDTVMILTYVIATVLNGLILFQIYYYGSSKGKKEKAKGKKKSH